MKLFFWALFLALAVTSCKTEVDRTGSHITKSMEIESMARVDTLVSECRVCHGTKEAQRGPILDGMEYWYLYDQLQKFRSGLRGQNPENRSEHMMGVGIRKIKNDLESAYIANWFSQQAPKPAVRTIRGDVKKGKSFMSKGVHPVTVKTGKVTGWYSDLHSTDWRVGTSRSNAKISQGTRGYHPNDEGGQVMMAASQDISDGTLKDVVAYVVHAHGPPDAPSKRDRIIPPKTEKPFQGPEVAEEHSVAQAYLHHPCPIEQDSTHKVL